MRIFITGGTGFVGRHVVHQLHAAGHKTRCLVRDMERARQILPREVELFHGDLTRTVNLKAGLQGCEAVIHLVGIIREKGPSNFERIHVNSTKDLLQAAREANIGRFIHMSALGSRADASSRYHQTKFSAEQAVRESGIPWTIFRPSVIYGSEDQFVNTLAWIIRRAPVVPILGDGKSLLQPINVHNVASCLALSVGNPSSECKIYPLGGLKRLNYDMIYQAIADALKVKKKFTHIPISWAKPFVLMAEWLLPKPPVTCDQLILLQEDNVCDPTEALNDFGIELEDFKEGIRNYLKP